MDKSLEKQSPSLEKLSPDDKVFVTATESSDSVFPVSQEERHSLAALKERADAAYAAGNYQCASIVIHIPIHENIFEGQRFDVLPCARMLE